MSRPADLVARRSAPGLALADDAEVVARACFAMADRFARGGTLLAFGTGPSATDAQHIAVEFVHPVIVGKRALPALSLATDVATVTGVARAVGFDEVFAHQVAQLGGPLDIALGLSARGDDRAVARGLEVAHERGLLTVALTGGDDGRPMSVDGAVDHCLHVPSDDPLVVKEVHVTAYHVLWELVHVYFEQPGLLGGHETDCGSDVCITCSDQAVDVVVVELLGDQLARVDTGSGIEEVSVALVDAAVGDHVLVHAGEAIAVVGR
ncbi:MAG: D-sedoheptulose 7-phosphate isomerase [Actinomycetota bacterium]|nr:D-sedoheptulose 7-phosphate isomerase [Actinomycetota bacterium]